ncbi:TPA: transcriptional regulator [Vibrio cholerae]|nr:transcriptional regulator [Vibrio cholerae]
MTKINTFFAFFLGSLLTGCAAQKVEPTIVTPPADSQVCCNASSQYPYVELQENEAFRFDIDLSSPVGHFPKGNSHFAAYRFSERSQSAVVTLSSFFINDSVFVPEVLLLTEDFQVAEHYSADRFSILPSDAFTRTRYIARFQVDAEKTPYLVIYTSANTLGKSITIDHPAKVRAREMGEAMPMVTDPTYIKQLGGELLLSVETKKRRPFRAEPQKVKPQAAPALIAPLNVQPESQAFYLSAIEKAVSAGDIPKALSLLDEAKALGVDGAQEAFVKAVNMRK